MSCESKFDGEVTVQCVMSLISDVRRGETKKALLQAMWLLGCLINKISTVNTEVVGVTLLDESSGKSVKVEIQHLDALLDAIEEKCQQQSVSVQASGPPVGSQGWEVFIPYILELIKFIIEQRNKKNQPSPTP